MHKYFLIDVLRRTNVLKEYKKIRDENSSGFKHLQLLQKRKLITLLLNVKYNDFYKEYLKGINETLIQKEPENILNELPIIDKKIIRENFDKIKSKKLCYNYELQNTGGSTGEPFTFIISKFALSRIISYNFYFWNKYVNYKIGSKVLVIGGRSLGGSSGFKRNLYNFLQNKTFIEGDYIDNQILDKNIIIINKNYNHFIYGYPSGIDFYVKHLEKINKNYNNKMLKAVICTSEMLINETKERIENYFKVPVLNSYGARDGNLVASEINIDGVKGFHYNYQDCLVESLKIDDNLGENELIITNLNCHLFPIIRYRVGDIGKVDMINNIPLIISFKGRTRDIIYNTKGAYFHGSLFNKIFKDFPFITKYQLIQEKDFSINLIIATKELENYQNFNKKLKLLKEKILLLIDDNKINITFLINEKFIYNLNNSKFKTIHSEIKE